MNSNCVRVTRGDRTWHINAGSAQLVKDVCSIMEWEFDTITDTTNRGADEKWTLSKLVAEIGATP